MMVPVGRIIIFRSVRRSEFIRAMNYLSVPAMLGPAVGPLLGGFITTYLHWRLIFFINIPIGIRGHLSDEPLYRELARGASGAARLVRLLSVGERRHAALARSLAGRRRAHAESASPARMCAGGAVMVVLYWLHSRRTERPLLDLRFFRVPTFQASVLGGSLFRIGLGAVPFLLPLALQEGLGMTRVQVRLDHLRVGVRRHVHALARVARAASLRLPARR